MSDSETVGVKQVRGRGRPPKNASSKKADEKPVELKKRAASPDVVDKEPIVVAKKANGVTEAVPPKSSRGRGRPPKKDALAQPKSQPAPRKPRPARKTKPVSDDKSNEDESTPNEEENESASE